MEHGLYDILELIVKNYDLIFLDLQELYCNHIGWLSHALFCIIYMPRVDLRNLQNQGLLDLSQKKSELNQNQVSCRI